MERSLATSKSPPLVKMLTMFPLFVVQLNGVSPGQGFGIEFLLTLQLVLCFLATMDKRRTGITSSAPFAVGLSVVLGHLAGVIVAFLSQMLILESSQVRHGQNIYHCLSSIQFLPPQISYTGCGMNPARSFGPALLSLEFEQHWVSSLACTEPTVVLTDCIKCLKV